MKGEQNLHHGQRLEELLAIGWRYKATAAKEFGVKPNTIQKWKNASKLNRTWFKRYGNVLMASGLNPEYIRDFDAPKTIREVVEAHLQQVQQQAADLRARLQQITTT